MRGRFLLSVLGLPLFLLPMPASAQSQPLGPWRWTTQLVPIVRDEGWGNSSNANPGKVAKSVAVGARWDAAPDSIRLYIRCENPLIAPARPRKGAPAIRFTAAGATVRVDAKRQRLLIIPNAATVTLWAYKGRALVFKHKFKAITPPLPKIECFFGGLKPTGLRPGEAWTPSLRLRAIPADHFSGFMPDDARYRVSRYAVTYLRKGAPVEAANIINGTQSAVELRKDFQEGDQLQIDVQLIQRMNFHGEIEDIAIQKQFIIPLPSPESFR